MNIARCPEAIRWSHSRIASKALACRLWMIPPEIRTRKSESVGVTRFPLLHPLVG